MQESCFTSGHVERGSPAWSMTMTRDMNIVWHRHINSHNCCWAAEGIFIFAAIVPDWGRGKNKQTNKQKTKATRTQEQLTTVTGQTSGRHLSFSVFHWEIYPWCFNLNVYRLAVSTVCRLTHEGCVIEPSRCVCVLCMVLWFPSTAWKHVS